MYDIMPINNHDVSKAQSLLFTQTVILHVCRYWFWLEVARGPPLTLRIGGVYMSGALERREAGWPPTQGCMVSDMACADEPTVEHSVLRDDGIPALGRLPTCSCTATAWQQPALDQPKLRVGKRRTISLESTSRSDFCVSARRRSPSFSPRTCRSFSESTATSSRCSWCVRAAAAIAAAMTSACSVVCQWRPHRRESEGGRGTEEWGKGGRGTEEWGEGAGWPQGLTRHGRGRLGTWTGGVARPH